MTENFNPLVSIVIPVYNGSNYMREAIDSARAQTYKNIEVLVINDGSNDNGATREIALNYGEKIRYFEKENGGVASALNLGIREMKGEYFSWLSHDDIYMPDKVEKQVNLLKESGNYESIIFSDWISIDEAGNKLEEFDLSTIIPYQIEYYLLLQQVIHGCTLLIPRIAFNKSGNFPENLPTTQDYTLWLRLSENFSFFHCKKALVFSRHHKSQGSLLLQHTTEVNDFFKCELKRMNAEKINKLFPAGDRFEACDNLAQSLIDRGYNDCAQMFVLQVIDMFPVHERRLLSLNIDYSQLQANYSQLQATHTALINNRIIRVLNKMRRILGKEA